MSPSPPSTSSASPRRGRVDPRQMTVDGSTSTSSPKARSDGTTSSLEMQTAADADPSSNAEAGLCEREEEPEDLVIAREYEERRKGAPWYRGNTVITMLILGQVSITALVWLWFNSVHPDREKEREEAIFEKEVEEARREYALARLRSSSGREA